MIAESETNLSIHMTGQTIGCDQIIELEI